MARYLASLSLATAGLAAAVGWQSHRIADQEAERAAAAEVRASALTLVVPLTATDLSRIGTPHGSEQDSAAALVNTVGPRVASGELEQVHVWRRDDGGAVSIVWSTDGAAVGRRATDGDPPPIGTTGLVVERVVDADYPGRQGTAPLWEAYSGFADRTGRSYVLEVYRPVADQPMIRQQLLRDWLPVALGGMLLLAMFTMPLSVGLARRAVGADRARRRLARDALDATTTEHRRIAEQLHENTIQDLAAAQLLIGAARDEPQSDTAAELLARVSHILDADLDHLRALLQDGHDHGARHPDLVTALDAWGGTVGLPAGRLAVVAPADLPMQDPLVDLLHGVARELLRNVAKHAPPGPGQVVELTVTRSRSHLALQVSDTGPGVGSIGSPARSGPGPDGMGLRLVRAAVEAAGGRLTVSSAPDTGTSVLAVVPTASAGRPGRTAILADRFP